MFASLLLVNVVYSDTKRPVISISRLADCMFGIGIALASFGLVGLNAPILLFEESI